MPKHPHEVLPTREARAQLPAMLEQFRKQGADADPVVIGARRKPEAVVLSYERYLQLAGGRERVRDMLDRSAESGDGLTEGEAMKFANQEVRAYRRERGSGA